MQNLTEEEEQNRLKKKKRGKGDMLSKQTVKLYKEHFQYSFHVLLSPSTSFF